MLFFFFKSYLKVSYRALSYLTSAQRKTKTEKAQKEKLLSFSLRILKIWVNSNDTAKIPAQPEFIQG